MDEHHHLAILDYTIRSLVWSLFCAKMMEVKIGDLTYDKLFRN